MAAAQILIARLFFSRWQKLFPPGIARAIRLVLYVLWAVVAFSIVLRFHPAAYALRWTPVLLRSTLSAIGNVWGAAAVPSLAIYYLLRFFTRRPAAEHSPGRRKLIRTAGTAAALAPFAAAGFGLVLERTDFHIKEIDLPIPGLHPDLEGLRIGQLSDLHV